MKKELKFPFLCPVCKQFWFKSLKECDFLNGGNDDAFCAICGWAFDENQVNDPEYVSKINNGKTINELKKEFKEKRKEKSDYIFIDE